MQQKGELFMEMLEQKEGRLIVHLPGERALQGKNMGRAEPRRAAGLQRSRQRQHARPAARGKVRQSGKFR